MPGSIGGSAGNGPANVAAEVANVAALTTAIVPAGQQDFAAICLTNRLTYRTLNGGTTWTPTTMQSFCANPTEQVAMTEMVNNQRLFVFSNNQTHKWNSALPPSGGWQLIHDPLVSGGGGGGTSTPPDIAGVFTDFNALAFASLPAGQNDYFASLQSNGLLYLSTDGGNDWSPVSELVVSGNAPTNITGDQIPDMLAIDTSTRTIWQWSGGTWVNRGLLGVDAVLRTTDQTVAGKKTWNDQATFKKSIIIEEGYPAAIRINLGTVTYEMVASGGYFYFGKDGGLDNASIACNILQAGGITTYRYVVKKSDGTMLCDIKHLNDVSVTFATTTGFATLTAGGYQVPQLLVSELSTKVDARTGVLTRAAVKDADRTYATSIGTAVVGGGTNIVPVYHDGTSWRVG